MGSSKKLSPPWAKLNENPDQFVDEEYLPEGFILRDPSKLKDNELDTLISHWRDREAEGLVPLEVKSQPKRRKGSGKVRKGHRKRLNRKDGAEGTSSDTDDSDEEAGGSSSGEEGCDKEALGKNDADAGGLDMDDLIPMPEVDEDAETEGKFS